MTIQYYTTYILIFVFIVILLYLLHSQSNYNIIPSYQGDKTVLNGRNTKPVMWIYVPDESNITNWKTYLGRYRHEQQLAIYKLCLTSLILNNSEDFHLVLLHKDNLKYYIPDFKIPPNASDINKSALKYTILHRYGGVFLPIHTLSFQPLSKLYESNITKKISTILFDDVDSNIILSKKDSQFTKELSEYFISRKDGLGGGSHFDKTPQKILLKYMNNGIVSVMSGDLIGKLDYEGREILSDRYISTNTTKFKDDNIIAHVLNLQNFSRDNFLLRMSEKQIRNSDMWIAELVERGLKNKYENLPYNHGNINNWRKPKKSIVYY
jgi:hypothetical protein